MREKAGRGAPLDEQNTLAGLRKFGATEQQLEKARAALEDRRRSAVFEVWPENWRAFELFQGMDTQWDVVSTGGLAGGRIHYLGLKYASLAEVERRLPPEDPDDEHLPDSRTLFYQLRVLENEALQHLNG